MKLLLSFAFFLSCSTFLSAQFRINNSDRQDTFFKITSMEKDLSTRDQMLVTRANRKKSAFSDAGYGYAYRSIHLEFSSKEHLYTEAHRNKDQKSTQLKIRFFARNGELLGVHSVPFDSHVDEFYDQESNTGPCFYSIDLINIPIPLLERTHRIELRKYEFLRASVN